MKLKAFTRIMLSLFLVGLLVFVSYMHASILDFTVSPRQASAITVIRVDPPYIEVLQNTLFNVSILIENMPEDLGVAGVEFKLTWNSSILNGVSMEEVLFSDVPPGEEDNVWKLKHDFSAGQVWYAYLYYDVSRAIEGGYCPKSGNGTLAIVTFESIAPDETTIYFQENKIGDPLANPIPSTPFDGTVTVVQPPPPVGGKAIPITLPTNNIELLAPYIGLTILLVTCFVTIAYARKRKRNVENIS